MKILHGFDDPVINEEIGSIDYMDDEERKMLRVIKDGGKSTRYVHLVQQTVEDAEATKIDEVFIVTNKLTSSARKIVKSNKSVSFISPNIWQPFSLTELKYVIDIKLSHLLGNDELGSEMLEQIETVKRNAGFHVSMKWNDLLMEDLSTLISIEEELHTEEAY
jgi:hypothetical protein